MRFEPLQSFAGYFEPGDATRYEMVVVETWDTYEIIVLNDDFFDKLTFLKYNQRFYYSFGSERTNSWTIKAAEKMLNLYLEAKVKEEFPHVEDI